MHMSTSLTRWVQHQLGTDKLIISPLRAEASHRQFYRIETSVARFVLMDSPPEKERNDAFVGLAELFGTAGLPVPRLLHKDMDHGWLIMNDLGPTDLAACYGGAQETDALAAAVATLIELSPIRHATLIPDYDLDRLRSELEIFEEWFVQGLLGHSAASSKLSNHDSLLEAITAQPRGCVHRDYHCRNLLYNDGCLGIVDFQDALYGPILYDLASLLHDCYHRFDEEKIDHYLSGFVEAHNVAHPTAHIDPQRARAWLDLTALQRQLKAVGIFARLKIRDDKHSHLAYIQPVLSNLVAVSAHYPELQALHQQVHEYDTLYRQAQTHG